jgi:hypothetical protein
MITFNIFNLYLGSGGILPFTFDVISLLSNSQDWITYSNDLRFLFFFNEIKGFQVKR